MMSRWKLLFTIFVVTFSTMLVEVLLTRVFSVLYIGQFAFLIISLALFGYGLSGVYLSRSKLPQDEGRTRRRLAGSLLAFALSLLAAYRVTLLLSIDFIRLFNPVMNLLYLVLNCLILLVPFFFGGVVLALIFSTYSDRIGRLYFIDLAGASLGSLAIIPLIPALGPNRILIILFALLVVAWAFVAPGRKGLVAGALVVLAAVSTVLYLSDEKAFPIVPKLVEWKRQYNIQLANKRIEFTKWSTIDKIDVAPWGSTDRKVIWINGGTMQSFIKKFDGNLDRLEKIEWDPVGLPFQLGRKGSAIIIGSAGGYEVLCALSQGFQRIVAVEMDPVICDLLKVQYANWSGRIFYLPQVRLLADEGRSVLKRTSEKFDVIQMVNSHNADLLLSGGLSISETYIYTVESFKDYWDHLQPDGLIYIIHWNGARLFTTALKALQDMGVERPQDSFFLVQYPNGFNNFFLKKGALTAADYDVLKGSVRESGEIVYSPDMHKDNLYYEIMEDLNGAVRNSSVNIAPVYDSSPYFNQPNRIGQFRFTDMKVQGMAEPIVQSALVYSNSIYLSILGLALLLSFVFIYLPLKRKAVGAGGKPMILYFFFIGLAFIMVEIIFIKIFQLFLGSPAISISIIIFSLLVSSGLGSLLSERLGARLGPRKIGAFAAWLAALLVAYGLGLFRLLNGLIFLPFALRLAVSFILISLAGFFMGSFFPDGIRRLGRQDKTLIGWAWGANSFATVLGSILSVIVSINWNFGVVLALAALSYLAAALCDRRAGRPAAA